MSLFLFMLGYESAWVVLVTIQLTELIFHERRQEPWLRLPGLIATALVFILGSLVSWYGWVKRVRPMVFHAPLPAASAHDLDRRSHDCHAGYGRSKSTTPSAARPAKTSSGAQTAGSGHRCPRFTLVRNHHLGLHVKC
jgi:hypothetical protein